MFQILVDFILHLDVHLNTMVTTFGVWMYLIVFLIIFAETGLVVTPFLPGDSLLFALGALASIENSTLNVVAVCLLIPVAAIVGDNVNYFFGRYMGPKVFSSKTSKLFNQEHLVRTQKFYEKYGAFTIVLARFVPIVRTFAPFVAGVGQMSYRKFLGYSLAGGVAWSLIFVLAGYYFGNLPWVKTNFHIVIFGVIIISVLPLVYSYLQSRYSKVKQQSFIKN